MGINKSQLADRLVEEFDCSQSSAKKVATKVSDYVCENEPSGLTKDMREPDYIVKMLQNKPPKNRTQIEARWNWWIGTINPLGKAEPYQIN